MIVILMGPSGAGKTTIGHALSRATGWPFVDADDLHPEMNVAKMRDGISLTDEDRAPWLLRVREVIVTAAGTREPLIVGCSALKDVYRHALADGVADVRWVFLEAPAAVLEERLARRTGHFAGRAILADQLRTLEEPSDALTVNSDRPADTIVNEICRELSLTCERGEPGS